MIEDVNDLPIVESKEQDKFLPLIRQKVIGKRAIGQHTYTNIFKTAEKID